MKDNMKKLQLDLSGLDKLADVDEKISALESEKEKLQKMKLEGIHNIVAKAEKEKEEINNPYQKELDQLNDKWYDSLLKFYDDKLGELIVLAAEKMLTLDIKRVYLNNHGDLYLQREHDSSITLHDHVCAAPYAVDSKGILIDYGKAILGDTVDFLTNRAPSRFSTNDNKKKYVDMSEDVYNKLIEFLTKKE